MGKKVKQYRGRRERETIQGKERFDFIYDLGVSIDLLALRRKILPGSEGCGASTVSFSYFAGAPCNLWVRFSRVQFWVCSSDGRIFVLSRMITRILFA